MARPWADVGGLVVVVVVVVGGAGAGDAGGVSGRYQGGRRQAGWRDGGRGYRRAAYHGGETTYSCEQLRIAPARAHLPCAPKTRAARDVWLLLDGLQADGHM